MSFGSEAGYGRTFQRLLPACERLGMDVLPDLIYRSNQFDRHAARSRRLFSAGAGPSLALGPMGMVAELLRELDKLGL